jgi:secondary thiamine-phosphate synthase enzyme
MAVQQSSLNVCTKGQGPHEITEHLSRALKRTSFVSGIVTVFCQHTSCSLTMMENADPSAWRDLQSWLNRLVPESNPHFSHTLEGPDDMPSHIKMALTRSSETIPFSDGRLLLGTWQGLFLWEHRRAAHDRSLVLTFIGE